MTRVEKKLKLSDEKFKRRIGTTKSVFQTMLDPLESAHDTLHESGGKPNHLSVSDKLLITLKYYREYVTMESIADGRFPLPGKKTLQDNGSTSESCPGGEFA